MVMEEASRKRPAGRQPEPARLAGGEFEQTGALPEEANEPELAALPRLRFRFDRHAIGRLRQLIDVINAEG